MTKIRKKTLQLLFCDYQRTACYYTIYRTFKQWSSDDFTTISRLFAWINYDYRLRLLLTSIGYLAKARKEIRRQPSMVPPPLLGGLCRADPVQVETLAPQQVRRVCTADGVSALASSPQTAGADPAGLAWSALCCIVWHGSITGAHPCTLIYTLL